LRRGSARRQARQQEKTQGRRRRLDDGESPSWETPFPNVGTTVDRPYLMRLSSTTADPSRRTWWQERPSPTIAEDARDLIALIDGQPVRSRPIAAAELVIRETTGPPPAELVRTTKRGTTP
jgi:hypothetical protein